METREEKDIAAKAGCVTVLIWMICMGAWQLWLPGKLIAVPVTMGGAMILSRVLVKKWRRRVKLGDPWGSTGDSKV